MGTSQGHGWYPILESRMRGNSHVRFGERGGETRQPQGWKVRPAPTLRSGGMFVQSERFVKAYGGRIGDISEIDED